MKKWKQALWITLIIAGILVLAAVIIGILNATVFDGAINFGWNNYRYDETGYTVGEGSVFDSSVTAISVDWLAGDVRIEVCQDDFISVSEQSAETLSDATRVHWHAEGGALNVKARESAWFFGNSEAKKLTLRIPEKMLAQLASLTILSRDGNVTLVGVTAQSLEIACDDGNVRASFKETPKTLSVVAKDGGVTLQLPQDASVRLNWMRNKGTLISNFTVSEEEHFYVVGAGEAQFTVQTDEEDLILEFTP